METIFQSIKTLEVCRVTPCTDSAISAAEFSLPLTYLDLVCIKYVPTERVFFYQLGENESTRSFFDSVLLPKLNHSLSLALTHFLPIAGNIIWPDDVTKPFVLYTPNGGVSLVVAESDSDFNSLSQNDMHEAIALHSYVPELPTSDSKAAIIAFQITFFPSQGFSIGISMHHAIFDGNSLAMFMKSWAHICKENSDTTSSLPLELTLVFDRTTIDDPHGLDMFYLNKLFSSSDSNPKSLRLLGVVRDLENTVRANFELSRQDITDLRRKISCQLNDIDEEENDSKHMRLSTFVLSYAYVIVSMVKAKRLERKGKVGVIFAADCRSRLNPPLRTNYFGNCVTASFTMFNTELILEENGIAYVANELRKMVKELDTRVKNTSIEQVNEKSLKFRNIVEVVDVMIDVAGSPRFDIYGTDFGWGKPTKTQIVSIDRMLSISMAECRGGNGGIEIGLALKKNEMEMFSSFFLNGLKEAKND